MKYIVFDISTGDFKIEDNLDAIIEVIDDWTAEGALEGDIEVYELGKKFSPKKNISLDEVKDEDKED